MSMDDDLTEIYVDLYMRTGQYPSGWSGAIFRQEVGKLALKALRAEGGRLPNDREQGMMRSAIADFMGEITGLRPPAESDQIPPEIKPHLDMLMFNMWNIARANPSPPRQTKETP